MENNSENYLMLSGIQHYKFCRRQWALIHIEQQWEENQKTVEGKIVHERTDQPFIREKRGNKLIVRAMPIQSHSLRINGICDVVEFVEHIEGVFIPDLEKTYKVYPVEYKRGKPKKSSEDILQLTAQAICLEEMLVCDIDKGYLFYDQIKRRQKIIFSEELRSEVRLLCQSMHNLFNKRHTPKVRTGQWCRSCSLKDICLPKIMHKEPINKYIERMLTE